MQRTFALLLLYSMAGACTSAGGSAGSVEISDSAGVKIVRSRAQQWRDGESWTVASEPQVTIGVLDGPDAYQLFEVAAAARQSDGSFVVVDGGSRTVRRYDASGDFIGAVGGRGSGPGEFQDPDQVLVTAGDTIVIWDNALYRLTRLAPAGELVEVRTVDLGTIATAVEPPLYPSIAHLMPDGSLLVRLVEKSKDLPSGLFRPRSGALRVSADLSDLDTLMLFGGVEQMTVTSSMWGSIPFEPAYAKRTSIAIQPSAPRVCIGEQERAEVVCVGPEPGARAVVRWQADPIPVFEEELVAWREITIDALTHKLSRDDAAFVVDQIARPTQRPIYSRLLLDRAGNLWVERGPTGGEAGSDSIAYLVFDPSLVLLGTVGLPPIRVLEIGDDYVMGIHRDELDVEYLHTYELVKPTAFGDTT